MKEFIEIIKNLWSNKKTRAVAILILYLIFFIFVFGVINDSNKNRKKYDDTNNNSKEEMTETKNDKDTNNDLEYLNNIEIVSYKAYDNNGNEILYFDENILNGNVIYNVVKNSILESTNYIEGTNTYYISIDDYEKIVNNVVNNYPGGIRIIIKNNNIVIDLSNYYGYKINIDIRS